MNTFNYKRRATVSVPVGGIAMGSDWPVRIQSMTNVPTEDADACVAQILALERAGCEIVRCTIPTREAAEALARIKKRIHIPIVADIHFDYRMAVAAIENGADKIRINPGNIGTREQVREVVNAAR